mgnify:CR=1 FL=1
MYFIIGIAVIGLFSILIKNPSSLLITLFTTVIVAFLIFLLVNALLNRSMQGRSTNGRSNSDMKKYRQAVKQSKQKYNQGAKANFSTSPAPYKQQTKQKIKRRRPTHLRVIDGKKSTAINKKDDDLASN